MVETAEDALVDGGAVDHITFTATDLPDMYRQLKAAKMPYRKRTVPNLDLHQVFIEEPSGVTIELNFSFSEAAAHGIGRRELVGLRSSVDSGWRLCCSAVRAATAALRIQLIPQPIAGVGLARPKISP